MKNEVKSAYFAGLIDGEGCIGIHSRGRNRNRLPYIGVKMTCERTVRSLHDFFGEGAITFRASKNAKWKDQWLWSVSGKKAQKVLKILYPYLITKRDAAQQCINFEVGIQGGLRKPTL